jgi:hypothetical protein
MVIDWTRIPAAENARSGVTRKTVCGEKMSAMKVVVAGGTRFDGRLHHHPHEQMLVVLSGQVSVQINDTVVDAEPETWSFFRPAACTPSSVPARKRPASTSYQHPLALTSYPAGWRLPLYVIRIKAARKRRAKGNKAGGRFGGSSNKWRRQCR